MLCAWCIKYNRAIGLMLVLLLALPASARFVPNDNRPYHWELGLQGGLGYYVGDATPHVFQNIREAYGLQFRYKFDRRWNLQVKGYTHRITGEMQDVHTQQILSAGDMWQTRMYNVDVMGEFNFMRFGMREYDRRVKPYTPYIGLGLGVSMYGDKSLRAAAYLPVVLGFRYKVGSRVCLNAAWQHNIYLADNLEGVDALNNTFSLNGSNIINNDLTSQIMVGITFEFGQEKKVCRICGQ